VGSAPSLLLAQREEPRWCWVDVTP